jgi:hypothetical protein
MSLFDDFLESTQSNTAVDTRLAAANTTLIDTPGTAIAAVDNVIQDDQKLNNTLKIPSSRAAKKVGKRKNSSC